MPQINLNVGPTSAKTLKKSNQVTTDSKGQKIVIMPAEERRLKKQSDVQRSYITLPQNWTSE